MADRSHPVAGEPSRPPDLRSAGRFLWWLARLQWRALTAGLALGMIWMLAQAALPWAVGRAVDALGQHLSGTGGAAPTGRASLWTWPAVIVAIGAVQAGSGVLRHRAAVRNFLLAATRTVKLLGDHTADAGIAVAACRPTGEVVSAVATDSGRIGKAFDVSARFAGALAAFAAVAVLLVRIDVQLGLFVLLGVPALTAVLTVLIRPLNRRQAAHRQAEGMLNALGADTAAGLRVLRGIGGQAQFTGRYIQRSQQVRAAGVRVAGLQALLDAAKVALPGLFVVLLTWLGARAALDGRISAGQLVTLYGYAAFLVQPLSTATEALGKYVAARVAAERVLAVLRATPAHQADRPDESCGPWTSPPAGVAIEDPASGLRVPAGALIALVSPDPDDSAALARRLARLEADRPAGTSAGLPAPRWGGVPIDQLPVAALRRRVLVNEAEPHLFTGVLREELDCRHEPGEPAAAQARLLAALHAADALDIIDALPGGLDEPVTERGRTFSGGQRQRLALARAVLADPEVLVLIEPTSAVDAHTEARIAQRLPQARSGRTTVVTTASPPLLDRCDQVVFLTGGEVTARGSHHQLLRTVPQYRRTVLRGDLDGSGAGREHHLAG